MADIAAELKVSTVTVSKALSGQKGVSEEMRERIKNLADEWGYRQPSTMKQMTKEKSYNIGIIVPGRYFGKYESFYWQIYQEVATKAVQKECFSMLEVINPEDETNLIMPKILKDKKVDGVILIGRPSNEYMQMIRREEAAPIVCMDFFDESGNCDAVISDGYYGTYMLTNYLFDMGHTEIDYVGTLLYTSSITDRYFGFCKALMEHGQKIGEDRVINDRDWENGDVSEESIVLPEHMPSAFVCNSDLTASALIKVLRKSGYRVPEDISVVGFDNYLYPGLCDIGITTYEVDIREMARRSINVLIKKISGETYKTGVRVVEGNIVYKDSVKKQ